LSVWQPLRARGPELMDLPDSDPVRLERTLRQMAWINRLLTGAQGLLRRTILEDIRRRPGPCTLLDVGCGGADLALWLARREPSLRITCLDHDPRVEAYARRRCAGVPAVQVRLGSAAELEGLGSFDYVFANHFLHHQEDERIAPTLSAMLARARRLLVVTDLLRSRGSYFWFGLIAAVFLHRSFAVADGLLSIRRGFRPPELKALLAGVAPADRLEVRRERPGRVVVIGRPESDAHSSSRR
jgi:2-polyprenyl-3-methyl-5-hydroxy-6-metoxy-1,4-benzoquinol methylase